MAASPSAGRAAVQGEGEAVPGDGDGRGGDGAGPVARESVALQGGSATDYFTEQAA